MLKSERRLLSKGVVSPTTYGTLFIRVAVAFIIICSSAAATLYVIALGVDQIYRLRIDKNVYYTPSGASTPVLLLPQLDATVGLVTACVADSFFARASRSGVQNLVAATLGSQVLPSASATTLQRQLESEFLFGYDTAHACGTNTTKLRSISGFGYASFALSLFFILGACISALLFCLMVGDTDVLAGSPSLDKDSNAINVDNLGIPGAYLMYKLKRHLVHEVPLLISLFTCSGIALIFSICAMGVTIAVDLSSYKCGTPVCRSFEKSMTDFFQELSAVNIAVAAQPVYSCKRGVALPFAIAGFVLSLLSFLFSAFIFGWFNCAHRRREMLSLRDQLFRLAEVQGLIGTITGGDTPFPLAQSRQVSGVASTSAVAVSLGERDASGNVVAYRRGASGGAATRGAAVFTAVEIERRQSRSVGARIGLYRTMKQFMASEDVARQAVAAQEQLELYSLLAMREALWYDEELRLLHRFTLNWFIGPPLDLCVLETNARQLIMDDYSTGLSALLKSIVSGFDDDGEPAQAWERGGPLPAAEASQWHRQTERWQQTAALMAPRIRMSASYTRADLLQRSPQAAEAALMVKTGATHTSLDTDRWLTILDRLRASAQEDGGFLTRRASPLLALRRSTSVFANFDDDDTSASSNVFSNPSFLPAAGDEALVLPVDHLRPHLVRAAYVTKAPPPPPARLTVLPQLDTKRKRVMSGKSGTGRRRRSASSLNNTSVSGAVSPHGRAPSPSTRSPAVTSHSPPHAASNTDNDSFPLNTSADRGDHPQAVVRPFSTRDGTVSGRSPFQNAMESHNASLASPRAMTPQESLAWAGGGAAPTAAFSPGSAWRMQRPT